MECGMICKHLLGLLLISLHIIGAGTCDSLDCALSFFLPLSLQRCRKSSCGESRDWKCWEDCAGCALVQPSACQLFQTDELAPALQGQPLATFW